jgi:hypothetical protein
MDQNRMLKPALIGGILLGVLSAVPPFFLLNCACCAWVIGGGILAAHLYVKASPVVVTLGNGFQLGLVTGGIGGIVSTIFSIPVQILMNRVLSEYTSQARQMLSEIPNMPPAISEVLSSAQTGHITLVAVIFSLFFNMILYGVIAMLGGALGVALFEKRKIEPPFPNFPPPPVHIPPPPDPPTDLPS